MELEEIFCGPFTTASTCFSCSPGAGMNQHLPFRFATENHILGLSSSSSSKKYRPVTVSSVPRDNPSVICVGFAQYPAGPTTTNHTTKEPIQALALIDPSCINQPEDAPPPLRQPTTSGAATDGGAVRDDISVVSNAFSTQDGGAGSTAGTTSTPMKGRRPSSGTTSLSAGSTASSTKPSLARSKSDGSSQGMFVLDASFRSSSEVGGTDIFEVEDITTTLLPPKARLILQIPPTYSNDGSMITMAQDYVSLLDFRPLSPCLARWGNNHNGESSEIGIFVGSADDPRMRLYTTNPSDGRLVAQTDLLPEEHFQMDTPAMGIDYHYSNKSDIHTLAAAGQDGTIQIVTWKGHGDGNDDKPFADISSHRVIVDGPLVSLQIQERPDGGLCAVIGSLCGYVCRLTRAAGSDTEWQGPQMVVQGLWNDQLVAEDSVLAVYAFGDCVALGTLGGRCLIYQAALYGEHYFLMWECTLPYSIHGLEARPTEDGSFDLIVVTRRSVHVFRPKQVTSMFLPTAKYSISLAKDRLQALLRQLDPKPEPDEAEPEEPPQEESEVREPDLLSPLKGEEIVESDSADETIPDVEVAGSGDATNLHEDSPPPIEESTSTQDHDKIEESILIVDPNDPQLEPASSEDPVLIVMEKTSEGVVAPQEMGSSELPEEKATTTATAVTDVSSDRLETKGITSQESSLLPPEEAAAVSATDNEGSSNEDSDPWVLVDSGEGAVAVAEKEETTDAPKAL